MNINELKIGDRVKYKVFPHPPLNEPTHTKEDTIIKNEGDYFVIEGEWRINKKNIISKLELLPPQYKEIKIEYEK